MTEPTDTVIACATPASHRPAPFDWAGGVRQVVFSLGIGFLMAGVCVWMSRQPNEDPTAPLMGIGATLTTLTLPWPGRIGRRRPRRGEA